jgi:hypothetical protein
MGWFFTFSMLLSHGAVFLLGLWVGLTRRNGGPPSRGEGDVVRIDRAAL